MDASERILKALTGLLDESHLTDFGQLPDLVARHAQAAGMAGARFFLADLRRQVLIEVTGRGLDAAQGGEVFSVEGTLPGRVYTDSRPQRAGGGDGGRWWAPVLDGTERPGVLRADLPADVGPERLETLHRWSACWWSASDPPATPPLVWSARTR
ncbi:hypothetical protein ABZY42_21095 [Streptomyces sp. NPDC006622]|uniref:hypothetical protein n=1 Tax=Streptomyces sp. NPDC006622 TaxID=3155459 RepID=UPI0033BD67E0